MFLEAAETLACPTCGPPAHLVVLVREIEDRRVRSGQLGCPACDGRFPVLSGRVQLAVAAADAAGVGGRPEPESSPGASADDAMVVAALLGRHRGRGFVLLGPGLGPIASVVAELVEAGEVIALETVAHSPLEHEGTPAQIDAAPGEPGLAGVSRVVCGPTTPYPLLDRRFLGAALLQATAEECREAARTLLPNGRLAVLRPGPEALAALSELPFEVLAQEARAILAKRR